MITRESQLPEFFAWLLVLRCCFRHSLSHPQQAGGNLKIDYVHQPPRRVIPHAVQNEALFGERGT